MRVKEWDILFSISVSAVIFIASSQHIGQCCCCKWIHDINKNEDWMNKLIPSSLNLTRGRIQPQKIYPTPCQSLGLADMTDEWFVRPTALYLCRCSQYSMFVMVTFNNQWPHQVRAGTLFSVAGHHRIILLCQICHYKHILLTKWNSSGSWSGSKEET